LVVLLGTAAVVRAIVALGPARASRDGLDEATSFVARVVFLGTAAIVRAIVALGPARAGRDGLDEATRFVARGNVFLGTAAVVRAIVSLGPARASRDGLDEVTSFVARVVFLGTAAVVRAIVALGPARAGRDGLNEAMRFVARGNTLLGTADVVRAIVSLGPARASQDGLDEGFVARGNAVGVDLLVVDVVLVELFLLRGEIVIFVVLLGDGRGLCRLGGRFPGAAAFDPLLRIALELKGLRPAALGGRLRSVEVKEEGPLTAQLLLGRRAGRLLPQGPACRLRFRHAAIDPGRTGGIPASWDVFRHPRPPRGPTSLLYPADVALANAPAAPSSPPFVRRNGLMRGGVVGAMMFFYLIWLVHGGFWMKK